MYSNFSNSSGLNVFNLFEYLHLHEYTQPVWGEVSNLLFEND